MTLIYKWHSRGTEEVDVIGLPVLELAFEVGFKLVGFRATDSSFNLKKAFPASWGASPHALITTAPAPSTKYVMQPGNSI